jgi:hypothetical protein
MSEREREREEVAMKGDTQTATQGEGEREAGSHSTHRMQHVDTVPHTGLVQRRHAADQFAYQ